MSILFNMFYSMNVQTNISESSRSSTEPLDIIRDFNEYFEINLNKFLQSESDLDKIEFNSNLNEYKKSFYFFLLSSLLSSRYFSEFLKFQGEYYKEILLEYKNYLSLRNYSAALEFYFEIFFNKTLLKNIQNYYQENYYNYYQENISESIKSQFNCQKSSTKIEDLINNLLIKASDNSKKELQNNNKKKTKLDFNEISYSIETFFSRINIEINKNENDDNKVAIDLIRNILDKTFSFNDFGEIIKIFVSVISEGRFEEDISCYNNNKYNNNKLLPLILDLTEFATKEFIDSPQYHSEFYEIVYKNCTEEFELLKFNQQIFFIDVVEGCVKIIRHNSIDKESTLCNNYREKNTK